jgi:hypothetical protein
MQENLRPFDELSGDDQKTAVDVAVALIAIGIRIPSTTKAMYDYVASEFARSQTLPSNKVRYALRDLAKTLSTENWTWEISKKEMTIVTKFTPERPSKNGQALQKPETLD